MAIKVNGKSEKKWEIENVCTFIDIEDAAVDSKRERRLRAFNQKPNNATNQRRDSFEASTQRTRQRKRKPHKSNKLLCVVLVFMVFENDLNPNTNT